jgi:hypothetical protein
MTFPAGWMTPITVPPGQTQAGVDPRALLPSRHDLSRGRLEAQRALLLAGTPRLTPIQVTPDGVVWDGHHAVRAAAEVGRTVDVRVVPITVPPVVTPIMQLPVR